MSTPDEAFREQLESLGHFIRERRTHMQLTLRDLAEKANVSNPYLSQIERGLHEPSVRVLTSIAAALDLSAETIFSILGLVSDREITDTERAIRADPLLTDDERRSMLSVYHAYTGRDRALAAKDAASPIGASAAEAASAPDAASTSGA